MNIRKLSILFLCGILTLPLSACANNNTASSNSSDAGLSRNSEKNEKFELTPAKEITSFEDETNVIVCFGDSITQGMAMGKGYTYPEQLQADIGSQYRVINAGVPGENSSAILSRANAIDFVLTNDVTFAAGEKRVRLDRNLFSTADGEVITYKGFGNQLKLSSVIIGGEKYALEYEEGETYDNGVYILVRNDDSSVLTLKKGTSVKYDYSSQIGRIYCTVVLMGANDGEPTAEKLVNNYRLISPLSERCIYIVPHYGDDYSSQLTAAFGDNVLNMRDYFFNHALKDYGLEATELDKYCLKKEVTPASFTYENKKGEVHLNSLGYKILADQVYKKGLQLGVWK